MGIGVNIKPDPDGVKSCELSYTWSTMSPWSSLNPATSEFEPPAGLGMSRFLSRDGRDDVGMLPLQYHLFLDLEHHGKTSMCRGPTLHQHRPSPAPRLTKQASASRQPMPTSMRSETTLSCRSAFPITLLLRYLQSPASGTTSLTG
jgi:hypothetical protein